jgi:hypothetical protein
MWTRVGRNNDIEDHHPILIMDLQHPPRSREAKSVERESNQANGVLMCRSQAPQFDWPASGDAAGF